MHQPARTVVHVEQNRIVRRAVPEAISHVAREQAYARIGVKRAGRFNTAVVAVSVSVLVLFVAAGIPAFEVSNLSPFAPAGIRGMLEAAALKFFAYTGYARVATLGEEVHDPRKTIPRAIVLALAISFVLYVAVSLIAVGAVGADAMGRTASPLQAAAAAFPTSGMAQIVGVGAMTAMLGVLLSQVFAISRMVFAMARKRDWPSGLEHVHPAHAVPDRACGRRSVRSSAIHPPSTADDVGNPGQGLRAPLCSHVRANGATSRTHHEIQGPITRCARPFVEVRGSFLWWPQDLRSRV